jgi:acetyl esterase/lipase
MLSFETTEREELELGITIMHPDLSVDRHAVLYYLHGGGLLFGTRDDLPDCYSSAILKKGFTLVATDYPLAPQASIGEILDIVEKTYHTANKSFPESRTFLCGRSAGAYLCLMLARKLKLQGVPPIGIMDFYGYCNLTSEMRSALFQPSIFYRRLYALLKPAVAHKLSGTSLICNAPLEQRFGLYVYARQTGTWGSLIGISQDNVGSFSLDDKAQGELPPLFITASRDDQDVPFQNSEKLAQNARSAETYFIDNGGHDFDRDTTHPDGPGAWNACLEWAECLLG